MYRIWGKRIKDNKIIEEMTYENKDDSLPINEALELALDEFTYAFDLQKPMWFNKNTKEMAKFHATSFHEDQFIEDIDFDYLEIQLLEMPEFL